MHVLLLGGTGFIGPHVIRRLTELGYQVTAFHRGQTPAHLPPNVAHIYGDRQQLSAFASVLQRLAPDVVIDMIAYPRAEAQELMQVFTGNTGRVVVLSSIDVYRAFGRLHGTEPGPPDPVPLTEDAPLRAHLSIHGATYEKRWVEEVVMDDPALPGAVLRLPAIYGAGDYRPFDYLKRMDDRRPAILMDRQKAGWRFSRGNVTNVAAAIVLAATKEQAKHRTYNVADEHALTQLEWAQLIAQAAGWAGQIITATQDQMPPHLQEHVNWQQDWVVDTSCIRHELGYVDIASPLEGVRSAVTWLRAHPPEQLDLTQFDYDAEDKVLDRLTS